MNEKIKRKAHVKQSFSLDFLERGTFTEYPYIRVASRHQVLEQDRNGKAWLIIGNMDISPDQKASETVDCTVLNLKNGEIFSPSLSLMPSTNLTNREIEVLRLIQKGLLSKEIADKLNAYGFDVIETRRMKDWVSMTAKMR